uniref:Uncharacterized protein n=1 Tax=Salmo trutta TaxID=8032 RepID=A0A673WMR9_SALTR
MCFKKTEVGQTCSKMVCQTWSMPNQRFEDTGLDMKDDVPKSDVNKEYYKQYGERRNSDGTRSVGLLGKAPCSSEMLLKLCKRGVSLHNIMDHYYGINDPVGDKLLIRASTMPQLDTPEDKTITTLDIVVVCSYWNPRGKEAIKDGVSEIGTKLDPVPGLPGATPVLNVLCVCCAISLSYLCVDPAVCLLCVSFLPFRFWWSYVSHGFHGSPSSPFMGMRSPGHIHYPSQDLQHMGAHAARHGD